MSLALALHTLLRGEWNRARAPSVRRYVTSALGTSRCLLTGRCAADFLGSPVRTFASGWS